MSNINKDSLNLAVDAVLLEIAQNVRQFCKINKIKEQELADRAEVDKQDVARIKLGNGASYRKTLNVINIANGTDLNEEESINDLCIDTIDYRVRHNMTEKQLADLCEIKEKSFKSIIKRNKLPTMREALKISLSTGYPLSAKLLCKHPIYSGSE